MNRRGFLVSLVLFTLLVHFTFGMPPLPDVIGRLDRSTESVPYYLAHRPEIVSRGVDQGSRTPFMNRLMERRNLDDNFNAIAILIDFSDNTSRTSGVVFDQLLFGAGDGTVTDYFSEVTYGSLTIVTVNMPASMGWQRAPQTYAYYVNG